MAGNKGEWIRRNRKRYNAYRRKHNEKVKRERPDVWRKRKRNDQLRKYGLTVEDYDRMFRQQSGVCAICRRPEKHRKNLSVDHNHKTNVVRSLLCINCNAAVGNVKEDPLRAIAVADYLVKHEGEAIDVGLDHE